MLSTPIIYTPEEIASITGGRLREPYVLHYPITGVSSAPGTTGRGDAFVSVDAYRGAAVKRAKEAEAKGAACIVTSTPAVSASVPVIIVNDPGKAHEALAKFGRDRFAGLMVGVTGSVGKTSTKDMIAYVLMHCGTVQSTSVNQNIGRFVTDVLAKLTPQTDAAVIEISMTQPGFVLSKAMRVRPDIAVITSIDTSHIGNHDNGTSDWIFEEKTSIFEGVTENGIAVVSEFGMDVERVAQKALNHVARVVICGKSDAADVRLLSADMRAGETYVTIRVAQEEMSYVIGQPGYHHVQNSLLCAGVLHASGRRLDALHALSRFRPTGRRMERFALTFADGGKAELLDDSYNASPASIRMMLTYFRSRHAVKRRVLVLGDIRELGARSRELHMGLTPDIRSSCADIFVAVGPEMRVVFDDVGIDGAWFATAEEAAIHMTQIVQNGDLVAVKASHGTSLGIVVRALQKGARKFGVAPARWSLDQSSTDLA